MTSRKLHLSKAGLAIASLCVVTWSAAAHPSFLVRQAAVGASYRAVIAIPHGCNGSPTTRVRVQIPEGVIGVKPMPKPGWSIETKRGAYLRAYKFYHGDLSEGVKEIAWIGNLPDEHYDEFVFAAFLTDSLAAGTMLHFPVYQDCQAGAFAWTEVPAPGQDPHALKAPAPAVALLPVADKKGAAPTFKVGSLVIEAPWARATPGGARVAGGYLKITNNGSEPDRLVGGSLPVAGDVEVHEMAMQNDIMKMRRLADGIEIKPGATVELKPGSYHLMFTGLRSRLTAGQKIKGTLVFQKAGTVEVEYSVAPLGAQSGSPAKAGGGHHQH